MKKLKEKLMRLYKTKKWSPADITILKWVSILCGMILGAYYPEFTIKFLWLWIILIVLGTIKIIRFYYFTKGE